jgi:hypothetical protein
LGGDGGFEGVLRTAILNNEGSVKTEDVKREERRATCGCLAASLFLLVMFTWPFALLYGLPMVTSLRLETSMSRYPGSEQVFSMSQYYGHDSAQIILFYRTQDDVETVKAFYEDFALPFVGNTTLFQPHGEPLRLGSEATYIQNSEVFLDSEEGRWLERRQCHWSQKFTCVRVDVVGYPPLQLPEYIWQFDKVEPVLPADLGNQASTLIVYSFYIDVELGMNLWST